MNERPLSVTVISWYFIVSAGTSLFFLLAGLNNPATKAMITINQKLSSNSMISQLCVWFVGLVISVLCGIMMLNRKNWARRLYVIWGPIGIVLGFVTSPYIHVIYGIIFFVICTILLFRPKANEYFQNP
jgi:hypothetical protein